MFLVKFSFFTFKPRTNAKEDVKTLQDWPTIKYSRFDLCARDQQDMRELDGCTGNLCGTQHVYFFQHVFVLWHFRDVFTFFTEGFRTLGQTCTFRRGRTRGLPGQGPFFAQGTAAHAIFSYYV